MTIDLSSVDQAGRVRHELTIEHHVRHGRKELVSFLRISLGECYVTDYTRKIAAAGFNKAIEDPGLAEGVNVYKGAITYKAVADSQGREYVPLADALA